MIIGVLSAIVQNHFKRILSYHIISQIGYMILGLGSTPLALAGSILHYPSHHCQNGSFPGQWDHRARHWHPGIDRDGGCLTPIRWSLPCLCSALSLAGMPPLSGFFAKLALLTAGVQEAQFGYVSVALLGSLLTLVSMSKIYVYVFGERRSQSVRERCDIWISFCQPPSSS